MEDDEELEIDMDNSPDNNHTTSGRGNLSNSNSSSRSPSPVKLSSFPAHFSSIESMIQQFEPETINSNFPQPNFNQIHRASETSSPLHFLAQASVVLHEEEIHRQNNKSSRTVSPSILHQINNESISSTRTTPQIKENPNLNNFEGREKINVLGLSTSLSIRLHKGNGKLVVPELPKPLSKKCRNRECNNFGGQPGKPRSIYCSKRCQSREQNLRQGRIKNTRPFSPNSTTPTSTSPFETFSSSPQPFTSSPPFSSNSPLPQPQIRSSPSLRNPSPSNASLRNPSPSNASLRNPSPSNASLRNPSPSILSHNSTPSAFSPVQLSSSIPPSAEMTKPILYRPTASHPKAITEVQISSSSSSSFTVPQKRKVGHDIMEDSPENLTLAPIRSN